MQIQFLFQSYLKKYHLLNIFEYDLGIINIVIYNMFWCRCKVNKCVFIIMLVSVVFSSPTTLGCGNAIIIAFELCSIINSKPVSQTPVLFNYLIINLSFSTGNNGVLYAFVSSATTLKERTSAMAHLTASLSTGFIIGPLIQAALVPIGHPGPVNAAWFHLDIYTAAALLGALTSAVNIFLLKYAFTEASVPDEPEDNSDQETQPSPPDYLALVAMVMLYCFILVMFASIETVSTPLCMHMFGWNRADASLYVGITFGVAGVVSIAAFVVIKFIAEWFDDRKLLITGFVFQFISVFCLLPWNKEGPNIDLEFVNASSTTESIGCPGEYDWCHVTPGLNIWQFFLSVFFISIGFPTCNVMTCIIFSKMLGPGKQGTWMVFLTSSGALGKLIGPVFVGHMYQEFGPRITFPSLMGFIFLTVVGVIIIYRRMVPYKRIRELKSYSLSFENRESYDLHTIEDIEKY
ncbi:major facilitator superfamily domain-containing protein 8-like [Mya arenaria]|uniref:major facilitator superfamily domain-containing protein 8-like n=1 Tax=Mya arenaria TaxID=6604 RepID=UPI0022E5AF42|nr:major facilitator superfamily domain-containing protein 8-like [Mya arenaria]XP_052784787.1 major facilitator superfamily domain-containing protein 8-like [Mya arenaria]XP_052784788.1 major facilitator superfamily domain-containing protein 8-like [Mya arenaria]